MTDSIETVIYLPLAGLVLLTLDQLSTMLLVERLATAGAARATCTVQHSIGIDGRLSDDVTEHAQIEAALALLPDAGPAVAVAVPSNTEALADALAKSVDVRLEASLAEAVGATTVTLQAGRGTWRAVGPGSVIETGEYLRAIVEWRHPLRLDPSAAIIATPSSGFTVPIVGQATSVAGGGC